MTRSDASPSRQLILALLVGLGAASLVFYAVPALDLSTASLFYDGQGFPIASNRPIEALRMLMYMAEDVGFLLTVAFALVSVRRGRVLNLAYRDWLYQASIFLLGPGLIVNGILKRFWGRARPYQITAFGGDKDFAPAWVISDQCAANCSFVSGEMAGATALAVALFIILQANQGRMTPASHRMAQGLALAIPLLTAWQRMAVGRHFLSDVVIAGFLVAVLAAVLRPVIYRKPSV